MASSGEVTFKFYWRGRKNQIREIIWTETAPWPELPRVGDSVEGLRVRRRKTPVVMAVSWNTKGSVLIQLNDVVEDKTDQESEFLANVPDEHVSTPEHDPLENSDWVTQKIVQFLNRLEDFTPYERIYRRLPCKRRSMSYAWYYVGVWLVMLIVMLVFLPRWGGWELLFMLIPLVRLLDLLRWYADLLLDRAHNNLASGERSLLLVFLNLIEITLIGAIWLRAAGSTAASAVRDSFMLVTQLDSPARQGAWDVGTVTVEVAALVLLAGGVAVLVGEVSEKLRVTGEWQGARK